MIDPLISLIIPSWQSGDYLEQTILSVLSQEYDNIELIIVDNESTDQTSDIIDVYREHFAAIIVEPDHGQSNAINKGMDIANGEILGWLNADDVLLPNCLSRVTAAFKRQRPDILTTDTIYIDGQNSIIKFSSQPSQLSFFYRRGILFLTAPSIFFSRKAYRAVGGLCDELRLSMDVDLCYRIILNGGIVHHLHEYCGAFRWHDESKTSVDAAHRSSRENAETKSIFKQFKISERNRALAHSMHRVRLLLGFFPLKRAYDRRIFTNSFQSYLQGLESKRRVVRRVTK